MERLNTSASVTAINFDERNRTHILNGLQLAEIKTVAELCKIRPQRLLQIRSLGKTSVKLIELALKSYGLRMGMSDEELILYNIDTKNQTDIAELHLSPVNIDLDMRILDLAEKIYIAHPAHTRHHAVNALAAASLFYSVVKEITARDEDHKASAQTTESYTLTKSQIRRICGDIT